MPSDYYGFVVSTKNYLKYTFSGVSKTVQTSVNKNPPNLFLAP